MLMVDENSSLVQAFECLKSSIIEAFAALDCDLTQTCVAEGSVRIHGKTAVNIASIEPVSYTHLTLPTNREV